MNSREFENKLTNSAKETLHELTSSLKEEILKNSIKNSYKSNGEVSEISVRDIIDGYNLLIRKPSRFFVSKYIPFLTFTLSILTFLILFTALFNEDLFLKNRSTFSLIGVIASYTTILGTTVFYLAEQRLRRLERLNNSKASRDDPRSSFIIQWIEVENYIRSQISSNLGDSQTIGSLAAMIRKLENLRVITPDESNFLIEMLRIRNSAVHGESMVDSEKLSEYKKKMLDFIQKVAR